MGKHERRVLIVEGDKAIADHCRDLLVAKGHVVAVASNCAGAVRLLATRPDVIVLDLADPADCFDFLRLRRSTNVPMVALSSGTSADPVVGADAAVRKPFDSEDFLRAVESAAATEYGHPDWRDQWDPVSIRTGTRIAGPRPARRFT